jgi:hypothetical protein
LNRGNAITRRASQVLRTSWVIQIRLAVIIVVNAVEALTVFASHWKNSDNGYEGRAIDRESRLSIPEGGGTTSAAHGTVIAD